MTKGADATKLKTLHSERPLCHGKGRGREGRLGLKHLAGGGGLRDIKGVQEEIGAPDGVLKKSSKGCLGDLDFRPVARATCAFLGEGGGAAVNDKYRTFPSTRVSCL